jgi:pyruvate dehydrogenase E1 component
VLSAVEADRSLIEVVQARVLWLATSIVHHANKVRRNRSGIKVGGHQASSASLVSVMSALYFEHLRAADRVSVEPHAAPVLHAIQYLLGNLDASYLTRLRAFGGLQGHPHRLRDPVPADFSTGSCGVGATAPIWSAVAHRYSGRWRGAAPAGRHVALVDQAQLDDGAVWEALVDPTVSRLGELLWIVDLSRASADHVGGHRAAARLGAMFEAAGWHVATVRYGRRLRRLLAGDGGGALEARLDAMSHEEHRVLLQSPVDRLRERLVGVGPDGHAVEDALRDVDDLTLAAAVRDLGGHDLELLLDAFRAADAVTERPSVIFTSTIKAWRLPTEAHPANHAALLTGEQWERLAAELGADASDPWARFGEGTPEGAYCAAAARRLRRAQVRVLPSPEVPVDLGRRHAGRASTQQSLGRFLVDLAEVAPEVASRVVTASPELTATTELGAWINQAGAWDVDGSTGRHVELGLAAANLVGLLAELGLAWARGGVPLLPIGVCGDPLVGRALEPWSFGLRAGAQSILVGTPSGVTLAPEGDAHQSIITPSIGLEQPRCIAWEPAFGQDLEWTLLAALGQLGRPDGVSSYFRLSTRPVEQALAAVPDDAPGRRERWRQALRGGYAVRRSDHAPAVTLAGMGAVMPEVLTAAGELTAAGIATDVVCLTSADLAFRALRARGSGGRHDGDVFDALLPVARAAPLVTVLDGHPHTLSFLGAVNGSPITCLGVDDFGQSGDVEDLYRHAGIDAEAIASAARELVT